MGEFKKVDRSQLFIKTVEKTQPKLTGEQRAQLIRRGNEMLNAGNLDAAERVFVTCAYGDGLVRLGDVFYKRADYIRAINLYLKAPDSVRVGKAAKRMSLVLRQWLIESGGVVPEAKPASKRPDDQTL